ncbi:MAG TPA: hypothetical protein VHT51_10555, partial [Micropepsaceae bacterium]|nr:hypothetical protein [Micropepsaceae bacterium]
MPGRILCFGFALAIASLCVLTAFAAPSASSAYPRDSDNLALGLDRLRWGMTSEEVRRAYPVLNFSEDYRATGGFPVFPATAWGPTMLTLDEYRYGACMLRVSFSFYHARLYQVGVHSRNTDEALRDCRRQVRRELSEQYGPSQPRELRWLGAVTSAFSAPPVIVFGPLLLGPPPPPPLSFVFSDANDISGIRAAMAEDGTNKCQSITSEFLPDSSGNAASTPMIAPRLKDDLGCDYPNISYRLQEQGRVVLDVRIL